MHRTKYTRVCSIENERFCCEVEICRNRDQRDCVLATELRGDAEESRNEESLAEHISFAQPSHSPLPNHVDGFDALQGPPRALKRAVAFGQPHTCFHKTMVLLHDII